MIVFFDTSVHVALMRGDISVADLGVAAPHTLRLSPIVGHDLLRGARRTGVRRVVERIVAQLLPVEVPSWRAAWLEAGRLLPRVFEQHEDIGLARLQNDCLIALTAHGTGALLVTRDRHFRSIARARPFALEVV
jgi:predicted nucleic acid-binding protein